MIRKAVVIGPESTGKSTLSAALAAALQTVWVPEAARDYCAALDRPYTEADLLRIAVAQTSAEDAAAARTRPGDWIICDTDLYVVKVWTEHSFGHCDRRILEEIARRHYDLYLLTGIDLPWSPDPLREHGAPAERQYFYHQYKDIVQQSGVPWIAINGNEEERLEKALSAIRNR